MSGLSDWKKNLFRALILVCFLGVLLWASFGKGSKEPESAVSKAVSSGESTSERSTSSEERSSSREENSLQEGGMDFTPLWKENPDIIGWIRIDGTIIDYPVLMSGDDKEEDYYLEHNVDGSEGFPACIYVQRDNSKDFSDPVTVFYGHNLKDGTMFTPLHGYEGGAMIDEASEITLFTPGQTYKYRIIAVKIFDDSFLLGRYDYFYEEGKLSEFLSDMANTSDPRDWSDPPVTQAKNYIVLSTCTNVDPDERLLVVGERI